MNVLIKIKVLSFFQEETIQRVMMESRRIDLMMMKII
jgi:hypothetical protein